MGRVSTPRLPSLRTLEYRTLRKRMVRACASSAPVPHPRRDQSVDIADWAAPEDFNSRGELRYFFVGRPGGFILQKFQTGQDALAPSDCR